MKNELKIFSVRLPPALIVEIKVYCASSGITVQELVRTVLESVLEVSVKNELQ